MNDVYSDYPSFFQALTGSFPYQWQQSLADDSEPRDRLIHIPTGFGKTAATVLAWLWQRLQPAAQRHTPHPWPNRLVVCLPMRVLVEQTVAEVKTWLEKAGCLWMPGTDHAGKVGVHTLMGGLERSDGLTGGDWHLEPEHPAILVGTLDMLLSRALNRGYASPRARWPMEFGLLNHDTLWVMDEVQLMDVGLATSAQLQQFRNEDAARPALPGPGAHTWWMSATLQPEWLASVDTRPLMERLGTPLRLPESDQAGALFQGITRPLQCSELYEPADVARLVQAQHAALIPSAQGRITLVVLNTVDRAVEVYRALEKSFSGKDGKKAAAGTSPAMPELHLIHSRFRPLERQGWRDRFLNKHASTPEANRIIVSTQVIEAGVDLSARCLITDLAPWPSLIQRFGRVARYGGEGSLTVLTQEPKDDKAAAPYTKAALDAARRLPLSTLTSASPPVLAAYEAGLSPEDRRQLYPYPVPHLLLRQEFEELFDTTPDLTGADLDISRFIRTGDERDVQLFWYPMPPANRDRREPQELEDESSLLKNLQPAREGLCAAPFLRVQDWLFGKGSADSKPQRLLDKKRAWVWSWLDGRWREARRSDLYPGQVVLVSADTGGYDLTLGWHPAATETVTLCPVARADASAANDSHQDEEPLSALADTAAWKTLATHCTEVRQEAQGLIKSLQLPETLAEGLRLAAHWHDLGKAHPAFQGSIRKEASLSHQRDLAKAPKAAWVGLKALYTPADAPDDRRPGFRHELASALALFGLLSVRKPDHPALLGPWRAMFPEDVIDRADDKTDTTAMPAPTPLEQSILNLDAESFDLVAYLVASHHGKVRATLHAAPADQDSPAARRGQMPIRGVCDGDILPGVTLETDQAALPALSLPLSPASIGVSPETGMSWIERVQGLIARHGVSGLAYLETCLRVADVRASRLLTPDPLLAGKLPAHAPSDAARLETSPQPQALASVALESTTNPASEKELPA